MSDNTPTQPGAGEQQKGPEPEAPKGNLDAEALKKELEATRKEAASYRVKAKELEKLQAAELEKQGEYKKLYEEAQAKLKEVDGLTTEISAYRSDDERQLEEVKKILPPESIALVNGLPPTLTTRERLKWAQQLAGKKAPTLAPEARPGAGDAPSVESVVEAFKKGSFVERARILDTLETSNPQLYAQLTKGK